MQASAGAGTAPASLLLRRQDSAAVAIEFHAMPHAT